MDIIPLFSELDLDKKGTKLTIEGRPYTEKQFKDAIPILFKASNDPKVNEVLALKLKDSDTYDHLIATAYHKLLDSIQVAPKEYQSLEIRYTLKDRDDLSIVTDYETGKDFVVDLKRDLLTKLHPNTFWASYTGAERKEIEKYTSKNIAHCIFDPMDVRAYYEKDEESFLNKYSLPLWRDKARIDRNANDFMEFLVHLFSADKKQISYTLGWLYRLIYSRNETALVLNGFKGVGKNMLYAVAKALVGQEYCAEAPKKFGVKEFNDIFRERILILIDEHRVNKEKYNFLKASFNEYQTIEAKGQAVKSTERVFTNFMLFHNSPEDLYLENSERRFAVMDITEDRLETSWSRVKIESFYKRLNDPESQLVADIGHYITEFGATYPDRVINPFELFLGEKYQEILDCHVSTIVHSILDLIERDKVIDGSISGSVINNNCMRLLGAKMYAKGPRARTIVREYKYRGKYSLGEVITDTMPWKLIVNPEVITLIESEMEEE